MAKLIDGIKKIMYVQDSQESGVETQTAVNTQTPVNSIPVNTSSSISIGADQETVDKIWAEINAHNLPKPDYLELKKEALSSLDDMDDLTDEQKIKAAFKFIKGHNPDFNKETILHAIDVYVNVVENLKQSGLQQAEQKRVNLDNTNKAEVSSLNAEAESIKKKEAELKKQIEELNAKYDAICKTINDKATDLTVKKLEVDNQERVFLASVEDVLSTLKNDKIKISNINL